jgi:hypothetical protein
VFDALVNRKNREITRAREPAVIEKRLQRTEDRGRAIRSAPDAVDKVGTGKVQLVLGNCLRRVFEKLVGVRAKQLCDPVD